MDTCLRLLEEYRAWEGASMNCIKECLRSTKRRRILWEHRTKLSVEKMLELEPRCVKSILSPLIDTTPPRAISSDVWTAFYDELKDLRNYYRKFGSTLSCTQSSVVDAASMTAQIIEECPNLTSVFTRPEELKGKVLDLTEPFHLFLNWGSFKKHRERIHRQGALARLKKAKFDQLKRKAQKGKESKAEDVSAAAQKSEANCNLKTPDEIEIDENNPDVKRRLAFTEAEYSKFVKQYVGGIDDVPRHCKYGDSDFLEYITCLGEYLESFYRRCNPLSGLVKYFRDLDSQFEDLWQKKLLKNWFPGTCDLTSFYCPFTDKIFGSSQAAEGHLQSKKYLSAKKKKLQELSELHGSTLSESELEQKAIEEIRIKSAEQDKRLASLEFKVIRLLDVLSETLEATLQNLRKKQSRTLQEITEAQGELEQDEGDDQVPQESSSDDSDAFDMNTTRIKNPLNLPVGWDGKPIPYWLYRLHGLSHSYTCEICGNQKYWGKKVFENHFREWRHAFGMRCLKIPNTMHFKEITKIEDALNLYEKLRNDNEGKAFMPDQEVEVEDPQGNVMTPQTYDDLRKQGLL